MLLVIIMIAGCFTVGTLGSVPEDWKQAVEMGNMIFSEETPEAGLMPRLSNGVLGASLGDDDGAFPGDEYSARLSI